MDEYGSCKVCGGEIPHGHANSCDIFKMERKINDLSTVLRKVDEALNTCKDHCSPTDGIFKIEAQSFDSDKIGAAHIEVRKALK